MKSLLESILGSTNTGLKSQIDKWCKENIGGSYDFDDKGRVINKNGRVIEVYNVPPKFIKFGKINGQMTISMDVLSKMEQDQYPEEVKYIHIKMDNTPLLKDKTLNINRELSLFYYSNANTKFENVNFNFNAPSDTNPSLSFSGMSKISLSDMLGITSNCVQISLISTAADTQIMNMADEAESAVEFDSIIKGVVKKYFKNFSDLICIELSKGCCWKTKDGWVKSTGWLLTSKYKK